MSAAIPIATAQAKLATWLAAEETLAKGQSVQFGDRTLQRADLAEVRAQITYWEERVNRASRLTSRTSVQRLVSTRG
jgi:flagella basal body P-ring formation protein FlgA